MTKEELLNIKLKDLTKKDNLFNYFEILNVYGNNTSEYKENFCNLYYRFINITPTISSFNKICQYIIDEQWEEYQSYNNDYFIVTMNKIMSNLRKNEDFQLFINTTDILHKIKHTLDDKYSLLLESLEKYHKLYHENNKDDQELEKEISNIHKYITLYYSIF